MCGSSIGEVTEGLTSGYRVYLYTHTGVPVPDLHSGPTYELILEMEMEGHGQGLIRMEGIFDLDRPYPIPYSVV